MGDWPNDDAKACYDFAITCLRAEQKHFAVRDPGAHLPMEMVVWSREGGQWAVVTIDDLPHALAEAVKLIEGVMARMCPNGNIKRP